VIGTASGVFNWDSNDLCIAVDDVSHRLYFFMTTISTGTRLVQMGGLTGQVVNTLDFLGHNNGTDTLFFYPTFVVVDPAVDRHVYVTCIQDEPDFFFNNNNTIFEARPEQWFGFGGRAELCSGRDKPQRGLAGQGCVWGKDGKLYLMESDNNQSNPYKNVALRFNTATMSYEKYNAWPNYMTVRVPGSSWATTFTLSPWARRTLTAAWHRSVSPTTRLISFKSSRKAT
jgi:hypothetical protein